MLTPGDLNELGLHSGKLGSNHFIVAVGEDTVQYRGRVHREIIQQK
jgi:hypothetical protein